jgi:hypothetical protein
MKKKKENFSFWRFLKEKKSKMGNQKKGGTKIFLKNQKGRKK